MISPSRPETLRAAALRIQHEVTQQRAMRSDDQEMGWAQFEADLLLLAESALAGPQAPSGWQPIETAVLIKDATRLLGAVPSAEWYESEHDGAIVCRQSDGRVLTIAEAYDGASTEFLVAAPRLIRRLLAVVQGASR